MFNFPSYLQSAEVRLAELAELAGLAGLDEPASPARVAKPPALSQSLLKPPPGNIP